MNIMKVIRYVLAYSIGIALYFKFIAYAHSGEVTYFLFNRSWAAMSGVDSVIYSLLVCITIPVVVGCLLIEAYKRWVET